MEEEKINSKKKTMLICSITVVAVILIVGISYAYWQLTKLQEDTNIISSGCFDVELEGNEAINLTSTYPMRIEEGMKGVPYTFTITNTCSGSVNYIVNLESLANTTFASSSIRVALDNTDKLYSEYVESNKYFEDSIEARTLISGILEDGESVTYNLRMWIDERAPNSEQNKVFASKIVVTSGALGAGIDPEITDLNATSTIDSITITYNANGDISTTCKYGLTEGTYDNDVANATNTNCAITGLTDNTTYYYQICTETGRGIKCLDGEIKTISNYKLSEHVEIGDYIRMTPTSTSYTPPSELTGCMNDENCTQETLNPSELNLWRVIKKNEDGTVDVVSEFVSSTTVAFYGKEGYKNFVGGLNTIATQYTDGKHVLRTRHIGYSNQTEKITDETKLNITTAPWTKSTSVYDQWTGCNTSSYLCGTDEAKGAGDIGYEEDYNLVNGVYSSMIANKVGTSTATQYFFASRRFSYGDGTRWLFSGRYVGTGGSLYGNYLYLYNSGFDEGSRSYAVRPIVTLKSTSEKLSGSGTSSSPYTLK